MLPRLGYCVRRTTGQQAGLFTGPNYTILKALTVIKLARKLNDAGVHAVPVFWVAAEDHDYQEIESATILDKESALAHFRVDLANTEGSTVGWLQLKADVSEAISACLAILPESEFRPQVVELLAKGHGCVSVDRGA